MRLSFEPDDRDTGHGGILKLESESEAEFHQLDRLAIDMPVSSYKRRVVAEIISLEFEVK